MKKLLLGAALAAASLISVAAYADETNNAVTGAAGGAVTGAIVGGPVGAVVGGGIGLIVGSTLPQHPSVVYDQPIVVGQAAPDGYTYYDVPNQPDYEYMILNNQRVIVDRHNRHIVRVIN
jgi:Protein of unknown function (DUF1236)